LSAPDQSRVRNDVPKSQPIVMPSSPPRLPHFYATWFFVVLGSDAAHLYR